MSVQSFDPRQTAPQPGSVAREAAGTAAASGDAGRDPRRDRYDHNKLHKRLRREVGRAIADFAMIEEGDRVMVCLSGGKDSYTLLDILQNLQRSAPVRFELVPVHLDQKQPGYPPQVMADYLAGLDLEYHILEEDTFSVVQALTPEGKTTCPVCSRLRRGILYACARRIGATKIALGHHLDDAVETLFLNLFHGGRMKAMPAKLLSDDRRNVVIRPLYYCREADVARWSEYRRFPIIPCNLCGSQDNLQRQVIKQMLQAWDRQAPGRVNNIARAMANVVPSHLADRELFDFAGLTAETDAALLPLLDLTSERLPSERLLSERLPSERLPSERLPSERLPSERLPSERLTSERSR